MDAASLACDDAREIISARLDGEATRDEETALDHHLATCAECVAIGDRLEQLQRTYRVRPAVAVPDLRPAILANTRPAVLGRGGWMRPALAWVGILLVIQNVTALFAGRLAGADVHLARHLGAFGVALGVGLLFVAWRPHRAYGILPFATALIVTMLASAAFDMIENGRATASEATHLTEIAGLVLVWLIAGSPGWSRDAIADAAHRIRHPRGRQGART